MSHRDAEDVLRLWQGVIPAISICCMKLNSLPFLLSNLAGLLSSLLAIGEVWAYPKYPAEIVREVCDGFFRPEPEGLCVNEDCGQTSAWYLFAAMGFYPVNLCGGELFLEMGTMSSGLESAWFLWRDSR